MTAAERHAVKVLIDRATRAKLQPRARHGARLGGRTLRVEPTRTIFFAVAGDLS